ncbi:uncharacterized protein LOC119661389 [Hermetia illucens]|uniref:uncharacterized protein LOC119661389 n=1 Tax=Hermetia illucens TaxID=343691 RepID=UPI0018CC6E36|nr:uncharacterized protein LOC119661389 [Hermetia illucens]
MLHQASSNRAASSALPNPKQQVSSLNATNSGVDITAVLLATARIRVKDNQGTFILLRALVDQGSQRSFISEAAAQLLRLPRQATNLTISGIGSHSTSSKGAISAQCKEKWATRCFNLSLVVVNHITDKIPQSKTPCKITELRQEDLADSSYNILGKIDVLLGADVYGDLLEKGVIRIKNTKVLAQKTKIGWILSGPVNQVIRTSEPSMSMVSIEQLDADIRKLWEQEELPQERILTLEEADCERQFTPTTKRDPKSGRYIVRLPIKPDMNPSILLHPSLKDAVIRLRQTEAKLERNPELKAQYNAFLKEYLELGHMSEVPSAEIFCKHSYYLPHHAVVREDNTTTKVRVVFNASHKTSFGTSLNDILMVGPNTQYTIFEILLRWRRHKYALAADIEKMYRQILVDSRDCDLLRIVWRPEPQGPIKHYRLNTVAEDEQFTSPSASESIKKDFYVDDLLTGSSTIEGAAKLQNDIVNVLKKAGFNIRKWSTNYEEVLKHVSTADRETSDVVNINLENTVKTLGLQWIPKDDIFTFKVKLPHISANEPVTKRIITSNAAILFDPLGWIQPIIIVSKIFIQRLWLQKLDWDKPVPDQLKIEWLTYMKE